MLDCEPFPGFPIAFDPSEINWNLDPSAIKQRATDVSEGKRYRTVSERINFVPRLLDAYYCTS